MPASKTRVKPRRLGGSPRRPRPEQPASAREATPQRLFIVDDHPLAVEAFEYYIQQFPECGFVFAGSADRNYEDLPERVDKAEADVVLIDVMLHSSKHQRLTNPLFSATDACRSLRKHLGSRVKLVLHTHLPEMQAQVANADADGCLVKMSVQDALARLRIPQPPQKPFGVGLDLSPDANKVRVLDDQGSTLLEFYVEPTPFALLFYLAEERRRGAEGRPRGASPWLVPTEDGGNNWRIAQARLWSEICLKSKSEHYSRDQLDGAALTGWRHKINLNVKGQLENTLVIAGAPGRGQRRLCELDGHFRQQAMHLPQLSPNPA